MAFKPADLVKLDLERFRTYQENIDFYSGTQWTQKAKSKLPGANFLVMNYAKVSIDKVTSFLVQGRTTPCYPAEETPELQEKVKRAEQVLTNVYDQNALHQLDWETEVDTAVLGDGCYKVIWDPRQKRIKVLAPDVRGLYAWWLGDDLSAVYQVASRYQLPAEEVNLLYGISPKGKKAWVVELWTDKRFELWIDSDQVKSQANPYGFIPFVIFPNLREPKQFWGYSDIPQVREVQRELNRSFTELSNILELSGHPITVLEAVEAAEEIEVRPGAVWTLPEGSRAYLLDLLRGGGVRLHIDYINILYRALHDLSETPRAAYGGVEKELSGAALQIELQSLIHIIMRKRTTRSTAYYRRTEMILTLAQKFMGLDFTGVSHRVNWGPVLPADVYRLAQAEQLLVGSMIHSHRTAADAMGVTDPDAEFDRALEERGRFRKQNIELPFPGRPERALESTMESVEEYLD